MQFTFAAALLLASSVFGAAVPVAEQKRDIHDISPSTQVIIAQYAPDNVYGNSNYGQTSRYGDRSASTLVSYVLDKDYSGHTCKLVFENPNYVYGSATIQLFKFVPENGVTFDPASATWNHRTGHRDIEQGRQTKIGAQPTLVYSFACPKGPTTLNYEIVSSNGDANIGWYSPNGGLNIYIQ